MNLSSHFTIVDSNDTMYASLLAFNCVRVKN